MTTKEFDLNELSKDELIEHIRKQNDHINQLKNLLNKNDPNKTSSRGGREFDQSKYDRKHVALKFFYLGWNYDGFVEQECTKNTIEDHLFEALKKAHLIESRETSNYNRCGRTDKGVSASSQVVSLSLRSKRSSTGEEEIKYCKILNKLLPKNIRCVCSADVDETFSARFNCKMRTYKYFFPIGKLDVAAMQKAADYLVGDHDFRNFCKLDKNKLETNYVRTVESVRIVKFLDGYESGRNVYELKITSTAFLWHQIRCIVAVLFLVGEHKEEADVVLEMFDLTKFSRKPQYSLAHELPLVLFDCEFDIDNWQYDEEAIKDALASLNDCWIESAIKNAISVCMLQDLEQKIGKFDSELPKYFVRDLRQRNYKKLSDRPQCDTQLSEEKKTKLTAKLKHKLIDKTAMEIECKKTKSDDG